jgi:hypothetical protein
MGRDEVQAQRLAASAVDTLQCWQTCQACAVQDLPGVFSAREFVWWYNGHPQYRHLPVDLSRTRSVAIAGLGNVAGRAGQPGLPATAENAARQGAPGACGRSGMPRGRQRPCHGARAERELHENHEYASS